jgi:hypothetical protein
MAAAAPQRLADVGGHEDELPEDEEEGEQPTLEQQLATAKAQLEEERNHKEVFRQALRESEARGGGGGASEGGEEGAAGGAGAGGLSTAQKDLARDFQKDPYLRLLVATEGVTSQMFTPGQSRQAQQGALEFILDGKVLVTPINVPMLTEFSSLDFAQFQPEIAGVAAPGGRVALPGTITDAADRFTTGRVAYTAVLTEGHPNPEEVECGGILGGMRRGEEIIRNFVTTHGRCPATENPDTQVLAQQLMDEKLREEGAPAEFIQAMNLDGRGCTGSIIRATAALRRTFGPNGLPRERWSRGGDRCWVLPLRAEFKTTHIEELLKKNGHMELLVKRSRVQAMAEARASEADARASVASKRRFEQQQFGQVALQKPHNREQGSPTKKPRGDGGGRGGGAAGGGAGGRGGGGRGKGAPNMAGLTAADNEAHATDKYALARAGIAQNGDVTYKRCRKFVDGETCDHATSTRGCMFAHT